MTKLIHSLSMQNSLLLEGDSQPRGLPLVERRALVAWLDGNNQIAVAQQGAALRLEFVAHAATALNKEPKKLPTCAIPRLTSLTSTRCQPA